MKKIITAPIKRPLRVLKKNPETINNLEEKVRQQTDELKVSRGKFIQIVDEEYGNKSEKLIALLPHADSAEALNCNAVTRRTYPTPVTRASSDLTSARTYLFSKREP